MLWDLQCNRSGTIVRINAINATTGSAVIIVRRWWCNETVKASHPHDEHAYFTRSLLASMDQIVVRVDGDLPTRNGATNCLSVSC
jgi:hypothetical protein